MENVIKIVPKNLGGRPKLSETEKKRRKLVRSVDPLKRITRQQRTVLESMLLGKTLEETAVDCSVNLDMLRATAYSPEMRAALAELRAQFRERIRDAALYQLACMAGCATNAGVPPSKDEKVRASALRSVVGAIRETSCDLQGLGLAEKSRNGNDQAETTGNEAKAADASPKLVIIIGDGERKTGDSGEAIDVTPELSVSAARTVVRDETV